MRTSVTLNWKDTKDLTVASKAFFAKSSMKTTYLVPASGDKVFVNICENVKLEFTVKVNVKTKEKYVNWARIAGPEDKVEEFLVEAGSIWSKSATSEVESPF